MPNYNRIGLKKCRFYPQNFHPREGLIGLDKWPESEKNGIDRDKVVFKKLGGVKNENTRDKREGKGPGPEDYLRIVENRVDSKGSEGRGEF